MRQHLIDPEICIRCNTCEETCPVDAVTHDARNYVVDVGEVQRLQRLHLALPHRRHRQLAAGREDAKPYTLAEQLALGQPAAAARDRRRRGSRDCRPTSRGSRRSPRPARAATCRAAVVGGASVRQPLHDREAGDRDGHRQLPPDRRRRVERHPPHRARFRRRRVSRARGPDDRHRAARASMRSGKPHHVRLYSVASPRDGERPRYNNLVAHGEARHRGPRRQAGARRRVELPVRPREGRRR